MKIVVYIDGYNLYYGALKKTPYRWLNLLELCKYLFPHDEIKVIKYYTAPIKLYHNDPDPDKVVRQQIYLRALRTIPNLSIINGSFLSHTVNMKYADKPGYAKVIKTEEKGTDVNIATHLVHDAHNNEFEKAVVITNDSDLVEPIKIVTHTIGLPVIVVSPMKTNSIELKKIASSVRQLRNGVLSISQFSNRLEDTTGIFNKPVSW